MRSVRQELRDAGQLFAKNPAMAFFTVLIAALAVSSISGSVCPNRSNFQVTRVITAGGPLSHLGALRRGAKFHGVMLRMVALPRSPRGHAATGKPAVPRDIPVNAGPAKAAKAPWSATAGKVNSAGAQPTCAGMKLSDMRFPEFTFLTPLL
ncbi:MAG: hypothetical protein GZ088_02605 [Acidipila sp.]|nr:hypothetical protein [Acidipila sp.]